MKPHDWKSITFWGVWCVFLALSLSGCSPWAYNPKVSITEEGGQAIDVSLSLVVGASLTLQAQSTFLADSFSWSSSTPGVATVDESGRVTAVAPGTATITVKGSISHAIASIDVQVTSNTEGEGEGEAQIEGESPREGEGENPLEGEIQAEGEGEAPGEGEGENPPIPAVVLTENDNGKTVSVVPGQEFAVRLASHSDGGYEWAITVMDASVLENLAHLHDLSGCPAEIEGCSGDEIFTFRALKVGETALSLESRRSWEPAAAPPAASFSATIRVVPAGEGEGEGGCLEDPVQMTPFSGRFGYGLSGVFGFRGSLTKQALTDPAWVLEGTFTFPTPGYAVGAPDIRIQESMPEQVSVTIVVTTPPSGVLLPQVITNASITAEIAVSNQAKFTIRTLTCPAGGVEGEGEPEGEGEGEWIPQGEASWIPGETSPAAWEVTPPTPTDADVIHFSGPSAVYQNLCHALVTAGQPQVLMDPSSHRIRLVFLPVATFAACDEVRNPVAGVQGSLGPLEKGDWIFYGQSEVDPLLNFSISLHVCAAVPGLDAHVKPIPNDSDGDYLTDAEEEALGIPQNDPAHRGGEVPAGVRMAHELFRQIEQLPVCPAPLPEADGDPSGLTIPANPPRCKTPVEMRCTEACSACGEPYNCGFVVLNGAGFVDPATSVPAPLQVSFSALHYMQHGSLSYGWRNDAYAGRVSVVALVRLFNRPPDAETVNLCEYLPLAVGNSWEYKPWNSPLTVLYPLKVTGHAFEQGMELWALSDGASLGYANGFLCAVFSQSTRGTKDTAVVQSPVPLLPAQLPVGAFIDTPLLGQITVHRGPLSAMLEQVDGPGIDNFPPGEQSDTIAIAGTSAAGVTAPVLVFARGLGLVYCRYAGPNVPTGFLPTANALLLNSAAIQGNESCPKPPTAWIQDGQCPEQWTIDPPASVAGRPIHFSGPTPTFGNACAATSEMGTPRLSIDPAAQRIELLFDPLPGPMPCPMNYAPVCGLQGVIGPLREGTWVFLCQHPEVTFQLSFTVQGAQPVNCTEAQWIPGETGPEDWTVEILPLAAPVNGIRIAGPTPVFANDCLGEAGLGGCPFVCRDDSVRTLTLLFEGPLPDACYEIYAPVCGLSAQTIGIPNGTWTFSAPTLTPPVLLTFTVGVGPGLPD